MKRGKFLLVVLVLILLSFSVMAQCLDDDGDGYGMAGDAACTYPGEIDCNDNNPGINPDATEVLNGIDDDCNGLVDDGLVLYCVDEDLDGFNATEDNALCPGGNCCSVPEDVDCDDASALANPGLEEVCGDGVDNDCDASTEDDCPEGENTGGYGCRVDDVYWADCNGDEISTAYEGDSVYLILASDRCNPNSQVDYTIKEDSISGDIEYLTEEYYLNLPETNSHVWAAGWLSVWLDDGTSSPDPEYYFNAKLKTPDEGNFEESGPILTVKQCPEDNPNCGVECTLGGGFMLIGKSSRGGSGELCRPEWDCSAAEWSKCDQFTGKVKRDISLCVFTGLGDEDCEDDSLLLLPSEKACSSSDLKQDARTYVKDLEVDDECGDGICGFSEDEITCPDDCTSGFPWLLLFIIFLILALLVGAGLYYWKMKKKPVTQKMPFESQNDAKAVMNYIKMSKAKGVQDAQIKALLKKSGWTDGQINYAFKEVAKPAAKPTVKPAAQ